MQATLQGQLAPLNDPGMTMYSTQNSQALPLLSPKPTVPTIRCGWGAPNGDKGVSTNVSIVTTAQSDQLKDAFVQQGFSCAPSAGGTLCQIEQKQVLQGTDTLRTSGEQQFLRDNGWVSTYWIGSLPSGYTADIVATLWHG